MFHEESKRYVFTGGVARKEVVSEAALPHHDSKIFLQIHPFVQAGYLFLVAVEHQGFAPS